MNAIDIDQIDFSKLDGLVPAVVQHAHSGVVLMVGFMNRDAVVETQRSGRVTFWSRNRQRLWTKGETSGHHLELVDLALDCDGDAVLLLALPNGPVCHRDTPTCFDPAPEPALAFLARLDALIGSRQLERPLGSYTTQLFEAGVRRIAQKVGEEAVETALAAVAEDDAALRGEAADLIYHLLVLLRARSVRISDVLDELHRRH
jgi:phosphoribosyl-ATP pyrophosphohydrolase/phosphoribosyl-AMP cyclohydrolase